jgi:endoglycosylceramidase
VCNSISPSVAAIRSLVIQVLLLTSVASCTSGEEPAFYDPAHGDEAGLTGPACRTSYRAASGRILDSCGRELILRAMSVSQTAKWDGQRMPWQNADDLARMHEWGFNTVRLLVFWDHLEPSSGQYSDTYIARVRAKVLEAQASGLYVILDMHQDLFGEKYGGDGFPKWASAPLSGEFKPTEPWFLNYFRPEVAGAFYQLWHDQELQGHLVEGWRRLAQGVADLDYVVGFELLNEPFPGGTFDGQGIHIDPNFENTTLVPLYRRMIDAIESVAPDRLFFVQPSVLRNTGGPSLMGRVGDNVVYAPHIYHPGIEVGLPYASALFAPVAASLELAGWESQRIGNALWIGEIGGQFDSPGVDAYMTDLSNAFNDKRVGVAFWSYDRGEGKFDWLDGHGNFRTQYQGFIRPSPLKVPGKLERIAYDWRTRQLDVEWSESEDSRGVLDIAIPQVIYPGGRVVVRSTDPDGTWSSQVAEANHLWVVPNRELRRHRVTVLPK